MDRLLGVDGQVEVALKTFEEICRAHPKEVGCEPELCDRHAVGACFVFLNLLRADAKHVANIALSQATLFSKAADSLTDMPIDQKSSTR